MVASLAGRVVPTIKSDGEVVLAGGNMGQPAVNSSLRPSVEFLVGVDAPELLLLDPAVEAFARDVAPGAVAFLHRAGDAGLQLGDDGGLRVAGLAQQREFFLAHDHAGAPAGEEGVVDPALGPFAVADAPPVLKLGGDLHRQARSG